ncbi:hypothetical protein [Microbacterium gorillae]|uniref:hypothetical protein n=1 Tax=Microbacterium gorillae TaxID=1231063 RepID=UPI003D98C56D
MTDEPGLGEPSSKVAARAASSDDVSSRVYGAALPAGALCCVLVKLNPIPFGSRVVAKWEPVYVEIPEGRSVHRTGAAVNDVLVAGISHRHNYVGSKPYPWTHWVLDMLGYQNGDKLHDPFRRIRCGHARCRVAHAAS